jgi:hypothetical protein
VGVFGGALSQRTLIDMLGRSLDTGTFLHGGSFPSQWNLVCAGENRILGTLLDSWRCSSGEAFPCEEFNVGKLGGGFIYWGLRNIRSLRDMQNAL